MEITSLSVVVPAYNEEDGIAEVVAGLARSLAGRESEIIVVDDGSSDATAARGEAAGATVIRHPVNRGYGRALVTGLAAARHPWILIIDGDGSYPAEEAARLVAAAPGFDMVVGVRAGRLFWGAPHQALLRWIYLSLASFVVGEPLPDANSGLRLFRKAAFEDSMPFLCLGYSFTTTMTLSFLQSGRFVRWVPIRFIARKGRSKVRFLRDILRTLQIMTQVLVYYNPLKLCATLSVAILGLATAALCALWASGAPAAGAIAAVALGSLSLAVFLCGCLLDAMRLHLHGDSARRLLEKL